MDPEIGFGSGPIGFWTPLRIGDESHRMERSQRYLQAIARIKPGITLDEAQKEMDAIAGSLATAYTQNSGIGVRLVPLRDTLVGSLRTSLQFMLGAVGLVLLIACCTFANLLLLRTASRQREVAIRLAVGASRPRIVRQSLTEAAVLTLLS